MGFALQTQTITGNGSATFTFPSAIGAYIYGIQQMNLQSSTYGAEIQHIGVSLSPQNNTGVGYTELVLNQTFNMDQIDLESSWTDVSVIAWLGSNNPPGIFMQNQNGVSICGVSQPLSVSAAPTANVAGLAGFSYQFQNDDSDFLAVGASVGAQLSLFAEPGSFATNVVAGGTLTGDSAFSGTVDAALFALTENQPGLAVDLVSNGTLSATKSVTVGPYAAFNGGNVGSAVLLIQSFFAQFAIPNNPTPTITQLQIGAPASGITLNSNSTPGQITFEGTQQLVGSVPSQNGAVRVHAANLITNFVLVALAE